MNGRDLLLALLLGWFCWTWIAFGLLWAVWLASWRALLRSREPHASHLKTSAAVMRSRSR